MKILIIGALSVAAAFAQNPPPGITTGTNAPDPGTCNSAAVGNIYVRSGVSSIAPINVTRCTQVGSFAYAWQPVGHFAGTTLPTKCADGDLGFDTDAAAGANLFGCLNNAWTLVSGAATPGTVTSVGFTGGLISVATATTTPAFTVAGTSGGIPYFSAASTWASSAALASGQFVLGGGAGSAPTASFSVIPNTRGGTGADSSAQTGFAKVSAGTWSYAAITAAEVPAVDFGTGASKTFSLNAGYFECTTTCTITMPVPSAGVQYCVRNANNVSTVITFAAIGSSAMYENTASTAYGTAGTGTLISGGAVGDKICLVGKDSTHYDVFSYSGTWTVD